jgi:predicted ferric reductase
MVCRCLCLSDVARLTSQLYRHAFTLTSAPEQRILTVHIRCRGDWTRRLRDFLAPRGVTVDYAGMSRAVAK